MGDAQQLAECQATLVAIRVALEGGELSDFELTLPLVRRVVDVLAALNRSNALLTMAEEQIADLKAEAR